MTERRRIGFGWSGTGFILIGSVYSIRRLCVSCSAADRPPGRLQQRPRPAASIPPAGSVERGGGGYITCAQRTRSRAQRDVVPVRTEPVRVVLAALGLRAPDAGSGRTAGAAGPRFITQSESRFVREREPEDPIRISQTFTRKPRTFGLASQQRTQ